MKAGTTNAPTNAPTDEQRFADVAATLAGTDADVFVLYGVQDSEAAKKIAGLIKTKRYAVTHHAVFKHGPRANIAGEPVAILSRREKMAGKSIEWSQTGRIEMPGGFAFAVLRHGQTAVCVYVTGLPGSLTNDVSSADGKYFARKRNYAAQYLGFHSTWLGTTFTNPAVATYVTGDFQLAPKGPVSDECSKILEAAGFRSLAPGTATDKSTVSVTNSMDMDRVQDPVFTKGVEFIASRLINRPAPEHSIVVCDLTFKAPGTTAKAAIKPPAVRPPAAKVAPTSVPEPALAPLAIAEVPLKAASIPAPADSTVISPSNSLATATAVAPPDPSTSGDRRWIWWTAAGAIGLAALGLADRIWKARHPIPIPPTPKQVARPLHLELQPPSPGPDSVSSEPTVVRETITATGQTDRVPWESPSVGSEFGNRRARMTPQLKQLMRDVVVAWLSRQRTHLLESHERGTEQVMELHSRVEKIKERFQERLRSQQQRISELDSALRRKEKIILELVRTRRPETGS